MYDNHYYYCTHSHDAWVHTVYKMNLYVLEFEEGLFFVYHGQLLFAEMWWPKALKLQTVQSVLAVLLVSVHSYYMYIVEIVYSFHKN